MSTSLDAEIPRILVYCASGPRMAALNFKPIQGENAGHHITHYLVVLDFVAGMPDSDMVKWLVHKNSFSQYDSRRSQVEGRDKETIDFRSTMHTRVLLEQNERLNEHRQQDINRDPTRIIHTQASACKVKAQSARSLSVPTEHKIDSVKQGKSSLDRDGCFRLTETTDWSEPADPRNIAPGLTKLTERLRRQMGRRKEVEYFAPHNQTLSPRDLSDLEVPIPSANASVGRKLILFVSYSNIWNSMCTHPEKVVCTLISRKQKMVSSTHTTIRCRTTVLVVIDYN